MHSKKEFPYKDSPEVGREKMYIELFLFQDQWYLNAMHVKEQKCRRKTEGKDPSQEYDKI